MIVFFLISLKNINYIFNIDLKLPLDNNLKTRKPPEVKPPHEHVWVHSLEGAQVLIVVPFRVLKLRISSIIVVP